MYMQPFNLHDQRHTLPQIKQLFDNCCFKLPFLDLSKAQRSFAQVLNDFRFECIGEVETDDEVLIGKYNKTSEKQGKIDVRFTSASYRLSL